MNGVFTVTFNALELASAVLIPEAREDANLYIVLFTDGSSNANGMTRPQATARTIKVANEIKHMRALKIITVGIGVSSQSRMTGLDLKRMYDWSGATTASVWTMKHVLAVVMTVLSVSIPAVRYSRWKCNHFDTC